jgi:hypothetical protein
MSSDGKHILALIDAARALSIDYADYTDRESGMFDPGISRLIETYRSYEEHVNSRSFELDGYCAQYLEVGHSGPGYYVYEIERPEEGSVFWETRLEAECFIEAQTEE